jgi:hypothetical protein
MSRSRLASRLIGVPFGIGPRLWSPVKRVACCLAGALCALKSVGQVLLGLIGVLVAALILVVAASWFIFEPPPENPDQAREQKTVDQIVNVLTAKLKVQYKDVRFLRDIHPKADACVRADITIAPGLPDDIKVGFLKGKSTGDQKYKAWIRFSNAADNVTADRERDFRGMSIKMFGVTGGRLSDPGDEDDTQDLLFIGHDSFFAGSPQHFHDFFAACVKGGGSCNPKNNPYVAWDLLTHPRGAYKMLFGRKSYATIGDIKWFSVAPFNLGDDNHVIKYSAFPCEQQTQYGKPGKTPYYLMSRLQDRLDPANNNHLCLNLQIQKRNDPASQPIENTLVPWGERTSPWLKVATIDIPPQIFSSIAQ